MIIVFFLLLQRKIINLNSSILLILSRTFQMNLGDDMLRQIGGNGKTYVCFLNQLKIITFCFCFDSMCDLFYWNVFTDCHWTAILKNRK